MSTVLALNFARVVLGFFVPQCIHLPASRNRHPALSANPLKTSERGYPSQRYANHRSAGSRCNNKQPMDKRLSSPGGFSYQLPEAVFVQGHARQGSQATRPH